VRKRRAWPWAAALLVAMLLGVTSTAGAAPDRSDDGGASGSEAIEQLGKALPSVARAYRMSTSELRTQLDTDPTLLVDGDNRLFYVEPAASAEVSVTATPFDTSILPGDAFTLQSRPGAKRVIYLDFDGATLSGTVWNANFTGGTCSTGPYDTDANPATFSDAERYDVIDIWRRVAEDYAPFDVNVTTVDPGYAAINRASTTDTLFGTRALITKSTTTCPNGKTFSASLCSGCGGVAYIGVFNLTGANHDYYQPAVVLQEGLCCSPKNVAEAVTHEVGHNLGLTHDGTTTGSAYYGGQGSWAPIMGVGYYKAITQWSKGEYSGANNTQDDLAVAVGYGLPLRADDRGNTASAATALSGTTFTVDGVIGTRTDVDAFKFTATAGPATITVTPAPTSPNLDIRLELRNSAGALLASSDPASGSTDGDTATGMSATITTNLTAAGTYTLLVDGVGSGSALTTGYSDYASLGNYRLTGTVTNSTPQIDVQALGLSMTKTGTSTAAGTATVTVRTSTGANAAGVTVAATWTVGTKATAKTAITSSSGVASFSSGTLRPTTGQVVRFCVTGLTLTGATWDPTVFNPTTKTDCASWTMP